MIITNNIWFYLALFDIRFVNTYRPRRVWLLLAHHQKREATNQRHSANNRRQRDRMCLIAGSMQRPNINYLFPSRVVKAAPHDTNQSKRNQYDSNVLIIRNGPVLLLCSRKQAFSSLCTLFCFKRAYCQREYRPLDGNREVKCRANTPLGLGPNTSSDALDNTLTNG
jgi:hypothetical protein